MLTDADGAGIDRHEMDRVAAIVSRVDASDVERVDPPAGLWGRIAAAVAAEPDRVAAGAGTVVEYAIDADDVVVPAGEEWSRFARRSWPTQRTPGCRQRRIRPPQQPAPVCPALFLSAWRTGSFVCPKS